MLFFTAKIIFTVLRNVTYPWTLSAGIYMFKVNNRNIRTRCEVCSNLTRKIPEQHHWRRSGVFIVNFEHILHLIIFLLLTLTRLMPAGTV